MQNGRRPRLEKEIVSPSMRECLGILCITFVLAIHECSYVYPNAQLPTKLNAENLNTSSILTASTASSCTISCSRSTDMEASRGDGEGAHDLATAVEQIRAMAEGTEGSRPPSLKVTSLSAPAKRPRGRPGKDPLRSPTQVPAQKKSRQRQDA
jgi:hypothetical protein